jgi:uncharacterized protein YndB with AHSA1/START domain
MPVISVDRDTEALTMTVVAEFDAPVERVWQLWDDPRQLERWWGPPTHPATVVDHDLTPGGWVRYFMTSPEGDKYRGWWRVEEVEAPRLLAVEDGFADDAGEPNDELPVSRSVVTIDAVDDTRTRMTITSVYDTSAELEQVLAMGMEEGIRTAVGQIDALLAED